jgi:VWFA-related protein
MGVAVSARSSQRAAGRRLCALTLMLVATAASAQVAENITVNYVEVPVTVVDRSGNPIRGLTKANFEITDEGKKRAISGFDAVDFASPSDAAAVATIAPAARRNFLLVFDLSFSSPASIVRAQDAAKQFVTKMVASQDRVGVASVDVAHGFRLLTSFTTDRSLVVEAIAHPQNFNAFDPLQLAGAGFHPDVATRMNEASPTLERRKDRSGIDIPTDNFSADQIRGLENQQDSYNRANVEREVNLLAGLSKIMRVVRGQKHLVLLSEGFDPKLVQGRDAGVGKEQQAEAAAVEKGEIWSVDNENRYGSTASSSLIGRLADIARRCDVILDAVDIRGVRTQVDASQGFVKTSNEGLHLLANATGGTVFQNANDLTQDFQRALKGQEVVYVLAFQTPVAEPGTFHKLKVKLVNVPGGRAVARSGYYEAGGNSDAERTLSDAEIIVNDIAQSGVHMAVLAVPFATSGANAQVPVLLEINGNDIAEADDTAATLEIFTYAFDVEGKVRDSMFQRITLDVGKLGARLLKSGVKYFSTLSLPPGRYAVKSLVRVADSDLKGFVRTDIVVPVKNEIAVSQPLFLDKGTQWVMIRGASHDATGAAYPFEVNGDTFVPSAVVRLTGGEPRRFALFVQNAAPEELTIATQPEATLVSKQRFENGSQILFELASATPAASALNVSVRKRGSDAERKVSVAIVP